MRLSCALKRMRCIVRPLGSLEDDKGKLDFSGNEKEALCRHKVWGHRTDGGLGSGVTLGWS